MRYAFVADLHGRRSQLEALSGAFRAARVDVVVVAGDYLECRVSKKELARARPTALADVVDVDVDLWRLLRDCTLVRGNQEERIDALVGDLPGAAGLRPLLTAPIALPLTGITVTHGHTFDWSRYRDRWVPTLDDALPSTPVVVFGHSHRAAVTTLVAEAGSWRYQHIDPDPTGAVELDADRRYLVNLPPAESSSRWLLHDEEGGTIEWRTP